MPQRPGLLAQSIADLMEFSRCRRPFCDFCGRWSDGIEGKLVKAPNGACICSDCVDLAVLAVKEDQASQGE